MENVDIIRKRVRDRREGLIQEMNQPNPPQKSLSVGRFIQTCLVLSCLILSGLIYMKADSQGSWVQKVFGINLNFSTINQTIGSYVDHLLEWDFLQFLNSDQVVNGDPLYTQVDATHFTNSNTVVKALDSGTVMVVEENPDGSSLVIVAHDGGFVASYLNVYETTVAPLDRVKLADSLGMMNNQVGILFTINSVPKTYAQIMEYIS